MVWYLWVAAKICPRGILSVRRIKRLTSSIIEHLLHPLLLFVMTIRQDLSSLMGIGKRPGS